MKIQYFSDLHLEFYKSIKTFKNQIQTNAPILLLNGDIGYPHYPSYEEFISHLSSRFDKIFVITGNHEYYDSSIPMTDRAVQTICNRYQNVSFLQNSFEDYQGYRFAGTTLWSHIDNDRFITNDFHFIDDFTIHKYNQLHDQSKLFISNMLSSSPLPIIMMTHHLPSHKLMDKYYKKYINYQQCFSSDCDPLIRFPIHSWIYGHTHRPYTGTLNGVNMYCNPIGYHGENKNIDFNKTLNI